ncbi:Homoserine kinase [Frankliniella fusca]|uniref:Homoserine kinase n=1 Tax=Frankliniella fusca TaxID=407009 RepID=A0AAE1LUV5_9NEOP|nr:Homoserine kinase [Frankliniella fusca]
MPPGKLGKRNTRTGNEVWLIGCCSEDYKSFCGLEKRLPTVKEVMRAFFANLKSSIGKTSAVEAARETTSHLLKVWKNASIPTKESRNIVPMILKVHERYKTLAKDKHLSGAIQKKKGSKIGETHEKNRAQFVKSLEHLFDISHKNALQIMTVQEDIDFYNSMKTDRKAFMDVGERGLDKKYNSKLARAEARQLAKKKAADRLRETEYLQTRTFSGLSDLSASTSSNAEVPTDDEFSVKSQESKVKINVLKNDLVTSTFARTSTSPSAGTMIVKAVVTAAVAELGIDEQEISIVASRSHLKRKSEENHRELATRIKQQFEPENCLLVHFDGKLFPSIKDSEKKADRLPIVVSGKGIEKLLGIPELPNGSGLCIADAVVSHLNDWELAENVIGLVFDTTSTNSGRWGGACVLIQQKLTKELLELACRHHVFELLLAVVFDTCIGSSHTPDLLHGDFLQKHWKELDKSNYKTAASTRGLLKLITNADDMIKFCIAQLQNQQPRDDYREFLELTILFLGGSVPEKAEYSFRKPGATNKTRWMAKALYCYKIWMFGKQLKLTTAESDRFFQVCTFLAMYYVKAWFLCPVAVKAPAADLELLRSLSERKEPHMKAAFLKLANHLWYLSEKLVCLALFDESVSVAEKRCIVNSIRTKQGSLDVSPRASLPPNKKVKNLKLSDFASKNSQIFFTIAKISPAFLDKDPLEWLQDADYNHGLDIVHHLIPVNDIAERGVSLIKKYMNGNKLTNNEDQRQFMLQAVEKHRQLFDKKGIRKSK